MYQLALKLLKYYNAHLRKKMEKSSSINFHTTSKINTRGIVLKENISLSIGKGSMMEGHIYFDREGATVEIGNNTFFGNSNIVSAESVVLGDDILVAWGCWFVDHNSHAISFKDRHKDIEDWYHGRKDWTTVIRKPVVVKNKAWIGFNSIILKGVTIGEGAVVGAGSVVTKDVPDWSVVAGNPAKVIKTIPEDQRS